MKVNWFDRGRDAFTEGHPRFIEDARISGKDRASWHEGWNYQSLLNNRQKVSAETREALAQCITETLKIIR